MMKETPSAGGPMAEPVAPAADHPASFFGRAFTYADRATGICFMLVVALNFASAASRYAAGKPIIGADEVQVYCMAWLIFLGAIMAAARRAHLRMDVLTSGLAPRPMWFRNLLESLVTAITCITMVVVSCQFAWQIHAFGQRSDAAEIPMWIPHISVAVGFLGISMISLFELFQLLRRRPH